MSVVFPNLFVLLVSPPGVGKTVAIKEVVDIWHRTGRLKVAPDDVTKASLLDQVHQSHQTRIFPDKAPPENMLEYSSLLVGADELGTLLPAHDLGFLSTMNAMFDNRDRFKETRRGREDDLNIPNPQITLLAGTQPDYIGALLPPEAWGMGFMARMLMIYQGKAVKAKLFGKRMVIDKTDLIADLKQMTDLNGEMVYTEEAETAIVEWYDSDMKPVPEHMKLKHYVTRRILYTLKLCIISAASRGNDMVIELEDFHRARDWLIEAEQHMPDVFKDMSGKSDGQVIMDLHYYVHELYWKGGGKQGVHRARIDGFLLERTPAYNAENILKICLSAGILIKVAGTDNLFIPGDTNKDRFT